MSSADEIAALDAARLADLRDHWGSAYLISHTGDDWCALSRSDPSAEPLLAKSADGLRELIRTFYRGPGPFLTGPCDTGSL